MPRLTKQEQQKRDYARANTASKSSSPREKRSGDGITAGDVGRFFGEEIIPIGVGVGAGLLSANPAAGMAAYNLSRTGMDALIPDKNQTSNIEELQRRTREGFQSQVANPTMAQYQGVANQLGQQQGQSLARRGLGDSPMAAGLSTAQRSNILGSGAAEVLRQRAAMEQQLAGQRFDLRQAEADRQRQLNSELAQNIGTILPEVVDFLGGTSLGDYDILGSSADPTPSISAVASAPAISSATPAEGPKGEGLGPWLQPAPAMAPSPQVGPESNLTTSWLKSAEDRAGAGGWPQPQTRLGQVVESRMEELPSSPEYRPDIDYTSEPQRELTQRVPGQLPPPAPLPVEYSDPQQSLLNMTYDPQSGTFVDPSMMINMEGLPGFQQDSDYVSIGTRPVESTNLDDFGEPKKRLPASGFRDQPGTELDQRTTSPSSRLVPKSVTASPGLTQAWDKSKLQREGGAAAGTSEVPRLPEQVPAVWAEPSEAEEEPTQWNKVDVPDPARPEVISFPPMKEYPNPVDLYAGIKAHTTAAAERSISAGIPILNAAAKGYTHEPEEINDRSYARVMGHDPFVNTSANKHGIHPGLIRAVIYAESRGVADRVSPAGAQGLMQLMPNTAKGLGLSLEDIKDPAKNIEAGTKYLRQLLDKYNDLEKVLVAYNWGMGRLDKYLGENPGEFDLNNLNVPESKKYLPQVINLYLRSLNKGES